MQKGEFIQINFEGKIKETGQTFDKGNDVGIVVGGGYVIPGLDDVLLGMSVGEKKTVEVRPEKGFGARDKAKVHTVPEAEFKKHGTTPRPGMTVDADNKRGRVVSVTSGRVMIDFNHPLAGKVLEYDIGIVKKIEEPAEKVKAILGYFTKMDMKDVSVSFTGKEVEIITPPLIHPVYKKRIGEEIMKFMDLEKVKFSEIFEKTKPKE